MCNELGIMLQKIAFGCLLGFTVSSTFKFDLLKMFLSFYINIKNNIITTLKKSFVRAGN